MTRLIEKVGIRSLTEDGNVNYILQQLNAKNSRKFRSGLQLVAIGKRSVLWIPVAEDEIEGEEVMVNEIKDGKEMASVVSNVGYGARLVSAESCDMLEVMMVAGGADASCLRPWLLRLLDKVCTWLQEKDLAPRPGSLRLVDIGEYSREYNNIKDKYSKDIIDNWGEVSDPDKFVYEDLGIAAYLLLIWRRQRVTEGRKTLQTFVDLGCGNGLLVYILGREGHKGVGYDVRERKIWGWFRELGADLREEAVMPGDTYPGIDWLVGNHSDELTPWLPVMAALSGETTSYRVLPCCPHDFTAKYQRRDTSISLYRDYLNYIREVGGEVGYTVEEDRLRIPSTKRVCQMGVARIGGGSGGRDRVREYVESKTSGSWSGRKRAKMEFVPRIKVEAVRNCTRVGQDIVNDIVDRVVKMLLEKENIILVGLEDTEIKWNAGGFLLLGEVAKSLSTSGVPLSRLKSECGGLQTLLRNHHYIFLVEKGGVRIRIPGKDCRGAGKKKVGVGESRKKKLCWHHQNHPQGCPLPSAQCTWAHGQDDIIVVVDTDAE